jgi:RNA polymerase sigma-70 factor (ECF subfamily)
MADHSLETTWLHQRLDRWKAGDLSMRDEVLRRVGGRLEILARKMLKTFPHVGAHVETGDVLQNAMMRLVRSLEQLRPDSVREFIGLAATHIRRELLDLARYYRRRPRPGGAATDDSGAAYDPIAVAAESLEDANVDQWCAFHVEVEKLPAEEREVIGLVYYHGWTQAEVAELFQVTDRTVRRWWQSAMLRLSERLKGFKPSPND